MCILIYQVQPERAISAARLPGRGSLAGGSSRTLGRHFRRALARADCRTETVRLVMASLQRCLCQIWICDINVVTNISIYNYQLCISLSQCVLNNLVNRGGHSPSPPPPPPPQSNRSTCEPTCSARTAFLSFSEGLCAVLGRCTHSLGLVGVLSYMAQLGTRCEAHRSPRLT